MYHKLGQSLLFMQKLSYVGMIGLLFGHHAYICIIDWSPTVTTLIKLLVCSRLTKAMAIVCHWCMIIHLDSYIRTDRNTTATVHSDYIRFDLYCGWYGFSASSAKGGIKTWRITYLTTRISANINIGHAH